MCQVQSRVGTIISHVHPSIKTRSDSPRLKRHVSHFHCTVLSSVSVQMVLSRTFDIIYHVCLDIYIYIYHAGINKFQILNI